MNGVWIVDSRVSVWTLANNEPREWSGMWIIQFLWPGLKLILAWYGAGSEWTRHQENCHKKRVTTSRLETGLVKVPRPQISEHLQLSLKMIRNLSTAKRKSQQTRKKSTCQDLRRWECDGSSYCYSGEASVFVSPLLNKTRQTGGWAGTVQTSDVRKQLSWEEMLTPVTEPVSPQCSILHSCQTTPPIRASVNTTLSFFWKNKLSLLSTSQEYILHQPRKEEFLEAVFPEILAY